MSVNNNLDWKKFLGNGNFRQMLIVGLAIGILIFCFSATITGFVKLFNAQNFWEYILIILFGGLIEGSLLALLYYWASLDGYNVSKRVSTGIIILALLCVSILGIAGFFTGAAERSLNNWYSAKTSQENQVELHEFHNEEFYNVLPEIKDKIKRLEKTINIIEDMLIAKDPNPNEIRRIQRIVGAKVDGVLLYSNQDKTGTRYLAEQYIEKQNKKISILQEEARRIRDKQLEIHTLKTTDENVIEENVSKFENEIAVILKIRYIISLFTGYNEEESENITLEEIKNQYNIVLTIIAVFISALPHFAFGALVWLSKPQVANNNGNKQKIKGPVLPPKGKKGDMFELTGKGAGIYQYDGKRWVATA